MSNNAAALLASAGPGEYVEVSFEDRREYWHLNDRIVVGESGGPMEDVLANMLGRDVPEMQTVGLVFQRADASREWLLVTIDRGGEEPTIGHQTVTGMSPESREDIEGGIEVHGIASNLMALKDDAPIEGPGGSDNA